MHTFMFFVHYPSKCPNYDFMTAYLRNVFPYLIEYNDSRATCTVQLSNIKIIWRKTL